MVQDNTLLPEASVYARRHDFGVRNSQMSAIEIPVADIKGMPSLFGEIDVIVISKFIFGDFSQSCFGS